MPAKSKQQQKFFGVVRAMQKGDIPKKGEAGEVADDMKKTDVKKMAKTKHKGLPRKVKKESISISRLREMVRREFYKMVKEKEDPFVPTYGTGDVVHDCPKHVQEMISGKKGKVVSHTLNEAGDVNYVDVDFGTGKIYENIPTKKLKILEGQTHEHATKSEPKLTEAKSVDKIKKELVQTIDDLKKNFPLFKKAKESGDTKNYEKYKKIALDLTKKKKELEKEMDKALGTLHADAELELKESKLNEAPLPKEKDLSIINAARAKAALRQIKSGKRDDGMGEFTDRLFGVTPSGEVHQITDPKDLNMYKKFGLAESKLNEAPMDDRFTKEYEASTKAFINHIKHELSSAEGADKSVFKKMLQNLMTVSGYPKLMARMTGLKEGKLNETAGSFDRDVSNFLKTFRLTKIQNPFVYEVLQAHFDIEKRIIEPVQEMDDFVMDQWSNMNNGAKAQFAKDVGVPDQVIQKWWKSLG